MAKGMLDSLCGAVRISDIWSAIFLSYVVSEHYLAILTPGMKLYEKKDQASV